MPTPLLAALLAVLVVLGVVWVLQRAVLYPGQARPASPDAILRHPGYESWWLETQFGRVEAWFRPAARPGPAPAAVFAHGNGELIDDWAGPMAVLAERGLAILLVEYPAYGRSGGSPSQAHVALALAAAVERLRGRAEVDASRLVYWGRSLGGGAVGTLLDTRPPAALVLQSTFTSVEDLARERLLLPAWLVRDPYRTRDALARYTGPTLVVHGARDDMIPPAHGAALAAAAPRGEHLVYDCAHNDCPPDWEGFLLDVEAFLERAGVLPGAREARE